MNHQDPPMDVPPVVLEDENPEKPTKKADAKPGEKPKHYVPVAERSDSAVRRALANAENKTLREIIEAFGTEGSYKVELTRKEPQEAPDTSGKIVKADGFIKSFENPTKPIDEDYIQRNYGGGEYEVKFKERKSNGTGWLFAGQRPVKIAGHPIIQAATAPTTAPVTPTGEAPSLVLESLKMAADQAKRADDRAERAAGNARSADDPLIKMLMDQNARAERRAEQLERELRELANRKPEPPPAETFQTKLLDKMIDGDSARVLSMRAEHDRELRMVKENAAEDMKRMRDSFERDRQDIRNAHERELSLVKQSYETQLATAKSSFEVQLAAAKSSFETQQKLSEAENRRIDKDNSELRVEVKDLRAKKDKSILEMAKELKTVKEAFDDGEDHGSSAFDKIAEIATNPDAWAGIANVFRGPAPAAAPAAPAQQALAPQRKVVRLVEGNEFNLAPGKYIQEANGDLKGPMPEKRKGPPAAPGEPQMPEIDPAVMSQVVGILEISFTNGQEPEIVAQGARSRVPEELLVAIRDHGVDLVMAKMAKLSGTSPLSTQAGRNWMRALGKALVGE